jgi:hypothetical protein
MKFQSLLLFTAAASLAGASASAAPSKYPSVAKHSAPASGLHMDAPPDFDAMLAFIDKLFPPQPDPDPARLALAQASVEEMWPDGAYGKMMSGFIDGIIERAMTLKKSDLEALGGHPAKADGPSSDRSLGDQMRAKDPNFDKRMTAIHGLMDEEAAKLSLIIDPHMRGGLARAMARRFDTQQLQDINAFIATPSGHAFASQYMRLWFDPDTVRSMFGSLPDMMKLMPEMMEKFKAVNEQFPVPPAKPHADKS